MHKLSLLLALICSAFLVVGCEKSDDDPDGCPEGLQDNDGDNLCTPSCEVVGNYCGSGTCNDASGTATCECATGYQGITCQECAAGYQDGDGNGTCEPDCATAGLVCPDGACVTTSGVAACACNPGYAGDLCDTCAAGYQDHDDNGTCEPDCATAALGCVHGTCVDTSGTAGCVCDDGYEGVQCAQCEGGYQDNDDDGVCAPSCAVADLQCLYGTCTDVSGTAVCACAPEHQGVLCDACDVGLQDHDGDGDCAPTCATAGLDCGHGACTDASGSAVCACEPGYTGASCDTCAPGYQDNDHNGTCRPDCATAALGCVHGQCSDATGAPVCVCVPGATGTLCDTCADGFQGAACNFCAPGYQDYDLDGVCQPTCATAQLACVNGQCEDWSGTAECRCQWPWTGALCDTCVEGYQGAECGECATGYVDYFEDGNCVPTCSVLVCGPNATCYEGEGPAQCFCDDGYQDWNYDGVCDPTCETAQLDCGDNGYCTEDYGAPICECYSGWAGPTCATCAPGYEGDDCEWCAEGWVEDYWYGGCFPTCRTGLLDCGPHGYCVNDGYGGGGNNKNSNNNNGSYYPTMYCDCYVGYQDEDGDNVCQPDCETADLDCGNGWCNDWNGVAECWCDEGYAGPSCTACAPGWQDYDLDGVCAPTCAFASYDCGTGHCEDATGHAVCVCDVGYQDHDGDHYCEADCVTAALTCDNAHCEDATGHAVCVCDVGYQDNDLDGSCTPDCVTAALTCEPEYICDDADGTADCSACAPGYQDHDGNGICEPTCATAALSCDADRRCDDGSGTPVCAIYGAATCAEVRSLDPTADDGYYWLAVGGDLQRVWRAYCANLATSPAEYLDVDPATNYSIVQGGGYYPVGQVVTRFSRVRLDPVTLLVKVDDLTYASSTGAVGTTTSTPYAHASSCYGPDGVAQLDLRGTGFTIVSGAFCAHGWYPWGSASPWSYTDQVTLYGNGSCGSYAPCNTDASGFRLQLVLAACPGHTAGPGCGDCAPGYQGAACDECAPGYSDPGGTGVCLTQVATVPVGSLLYDDSWLFGGSPVEWRVVHRGYGGAADTATLMATRKVIDKSLHDPGWFNHWDGVTLRTWLNDAGFYGQFSATFQAAVVSTSVPWALDNPQSTPSSGVTDDFVFIASRAELGGVAMTGDGTTLEWYNDPVTAPARRTQPGIYWTRTGANGIWDSQLYDMSAYYVMPDGSFLSGAWSYDVFGILPVVNVRGSTYLVPLPDRRFKVWVP
jgi:hypothetical protein